MRDRAEQCLQLAHRSNTSITETLKWRHVDEVRTCTLGCVLCGVAIVWGCDCYQAILDPAEYGSQSWLHSADPRGSWIRVPQNALFAHPHCVMDLPDLAFPPLQLVRFQRLVPI